MISDLDYVARQLASDLDLEYLGSTPNEAGVTLRTSKGDVELSTADFAVEGLDDDARLAKLCDLVHMALDSLIDRAPTELEVVYDYAAIIATSIGLELVKVEQHPSGAFALHTNVGKGYLPDGTPTFGPELAPALATTLQLMKDIADGKFAPSEDPELTGDTYAIKPVNLAGAALPTLGDGTVVVEPEFVATIEKVDVETGTVTVGPTEVKPKRGRKAKAAKNEDESAGGSDLSGPVAPEDQVAEEPSA